MAVWVYGASAGVDRWNDGEIILVFVKVDGSRRDRFIEGIKEGGIMWSEGEFTDEVGEVKGCSGVSGGSFSACGLQKQNMRMRCGRANYYDPNAAHIQYIHALGP